jgi:hypothetical protein
MDMDNDILARLTRLPDGQLLAQVKNLIARERGATADIVAHLAELDTRDAHLREGYPSLYVYCRDALRLSEWEAYNRIEVARTARRFPVILGLLAEGAINLTTVRLLAPHLTADNHREVLESARGKTKAEVEGIVARLAPQPDVPTSVRPLPHRLDSQAVVPAAVMLLTDAGQAESVAEMLGTPTATPVGAVRSVVSSPHSGAAVAPLSPDRYKLQVTISGETLEKLRLATDMLGHANPSGDEAEVLDRALTALLAELAKKKFADTAKPRPSYGSTSNKPKSNGPRPNGPKRGARTPSAAVKRAVWLRDLGRCAFLGATGHRCGERRFVEFHHVDPYALGGEATVDGIQLRCRRHNDYEGRLYFGRRRGAAELVPEQVRLSPTRSSSMRSEDHA